MACFSIKNLTFSYPGSDRPVLDDVNLKIDQGDFVVICGKSGCGKTTLLRHFKSVLMPHGRRSGSVMIDGTPIEAVSLRDQSAKIGFVMQDPDDQIVTDKVWHELAFGLENLGVDQGSMRLRVAEMASYFGIQNWFHRETAELSGGQKQLLNLASIMALQPDVLILDEPTSQLDPIAAGNFLNTVKRINTELGTTIIITEHRLEDVFPIADRVVVMENGRILADDAPEKISTRLLADEHEMAAALPSPARIFYGSGAAGTCPLTVREGRKWLTSICSSEDIPLKEPVASASRKSPSELVIQIQNVWFRYEKDAPDVLRELSLQIPKGSIYAVMGGNGSGKSTLLKLIAGICRPYRGNVIVFGEKIRRNSFKDGIAMLPQDPKCLFVTESVRMDLSEMSGSTTAVDEVTSLCGIEPILDRHPYDLSGGEIQRAAFAKVLLTAPKLLLLDEPTKGLDTISKQRFAVLLRELQNRGVTIILVSHDIEFCAEYTDLVSMIFDGQIVTTGTPHQFFGQNSFYTTAANRVSRSIFHNAVTVGDVTELIRRNREETK